MACLNVHTTLIPSGEIRGFLVARRIPEPSTILLAGFGMLALALISRRRRVPARR